MFKTSSKLVFLVGFLIGFLIVFFRIDRRHENVKTLIENNSRLFDEKTYNIWFKSNNLSRTSVNMDQLRYSSEKYLLEADYLYEKINILCLILVQKSSHKIAANSTWSRSCNNVLFVDLSSFNNKIPYKRTNRNSSWSILCKTLMDISDSFTFSWVLVVYSNTFAIIENLRYLVAGLKEDVLYYLGHGMSFWGVHYNAASAGYVLSRGTVLKFKEYMNLTDNCFEGKIFMNREDYYLGKFLSALNVHPVDTRDWLGFTTFHGFSLPKLFSPGSITLSSYYKNSLYPTKCCSSYSVTFKCSSSDRMYTFYYLLHRVQLFQEGNLGNKIPSPSKSETEVWRSFLREQNISKVDVSAGEYYKIWENVLSDPNVFAQSFQREHKDYED